MSTSQTTPTINLTTRQVFDILVERRQVRFVVQNRVGQIAIASLNRHQDGPGQMFLDLDVVGEYGTSRQIHRFGCDFPSWWLIAITISETRILAIV